MQAHEYVVLEVAREVERAMAKHPPMHSPHEAYAVILEELDEFKAEVWRQTGARSATTMRKELIQTAAMCVRTVVDLALAASEED